MRTRTKITSTLQSFIFSAPATARGFLSWMEAGARGDQEAGLRSPSWLAAIGGMRLIPFPHQNDLVM